MKIINENFFYLQNIIIIISCFTDKYPSYHNIALFTLVQQPSLVTQANFKLIKGLRLRLKLGIGLGLGLYFYAASPLNYLFKTNYTISRSAFFPFYAKPCSPSNIVILSNLASPIPTIMIDIGKIDISIVVSITFSISWISPSVKTNKI